MAKKPSDALRALIRRLRQVKVPKSVWALRRIIEDAGTRPQLVDEVADWFSGHPPGSSPSDLLDQAPR